MDTIFTSEKNEPPTNAQLVTRPAFTGAAAAVGVTGIVGMSTSRAAAAAAPAVADKTFHDGLPTRRHVVIRHAYVMTMDPLRGDLVDADVHVKNSTIVAVGRRLSAPGADEIDGRGTIVLPGIVDTHWHLWTALLRSMAGDTAARGYFPMSTTLGAAYEPQDMYRGGLMAAAEAIASGITFVHDWCHNIRTPEYANQAVLALVHSGLRGRFSYGHPAGLPIPESMDVADMERLHGEWPQRSGGLLELGLAWRGMRFSGVSRPSSVYLHEIRTARRLGLPVSTHANIVLGLSDGEIADLAKAGLLGNDVQIIHATNATNDEIHGIATSGATVSLSPNTEMRIGFGLPPINEMLAAGIPLGLSVDTTALAGNADPFTVMKALLNVANGQARNEFALSPRRVLELATIDGARTMGTDDRIGSLVPGKKADMIMVDTTGVNIGPFTDPAYLLVEAAQPRNVVMVMVDGRILKLQGTLTALDPEYLVRDAATALTRIRAAAHW